MAYLTSLYDNKELNRISFHQLQQQIDNPVYKKDENTKIDHHFDQNYRQNHEYFLFPFHYKL